MNCYQRQMNNLLSEFRLLPKEVTEQWDERGTPPVIGKNEKGIVKSFKKLKSNPTRLLGKGYDRR